MAKTHILLVEDYVDARRMMRLLLERHGYEVSEAESFEEAIAVAAARGVDWLVCDLHLPGRSGVELMAELRSGYGMRGIALTADWRPEMKRVAMAAGFEALLVKPAAIEEILTHLPPPVRAVDGRDVGGDLKSGI